MGLMFDEYISGSHVTACPLAAVQGTYLLCAGGSVAACEPLGCRGLQTRQMLIGFSQLLQAYVKDQWATTVCSVLCWMSGDAKELAVHTESHITEETRTSSVLQASCFCFVLFDLHLDMSRGNLPLKPHTAAP
jgi:hypothetical protein